MRKFFRITLFTLIFLALVVPPGFAQVSRTTGALVGTVVDNTGAPLPGVSVTISSPQLQGTRSETTNAAGEYILPIVPPGTYKIEFSLQGIPSVTRENVTVNLNQTTRINATMKLTVAEIITVTANQVVIDPTQTVQQTNFKADQLKFAVVGATNRSYQNVLQQAAGVAGGGNPQVMGANLAQNNFMLDGINTTDPVTHTFGNNLAFDAIQEISLQTLGKPAEYGSSGGTVNVITKSGGNSLSGSFDWRYNDTDLQTAGEKKHPTGFAYYGATPTGSTLNFNKNLQPRKFSQPQATVGGPVLRDRLWFFTAISRPDTAVTPPNTQGFQPGTRRFQGWSNLGKMTFTPKANQTLAFSLIDSYARIPHVENSSLYSPEAGALQTQGSRTYGLTYDSVLSSQWLVNAQLGHTPGRLAISPISGNDAPGTYNADNGVNTGNYTNNQARTSKRDELLANTTYYLQKFGTNAFKLGIDVQNTSFDSANNLSGDPTLIPGWDPSFCSPAYGIPAGYSCAAWIGIVPSGPFQYIGVSPVTPFHEVSSRSSAFFAQDEWNPISQLTVRAGVRYESVSWDSNSPVNPPTFKKWQPRLGVAYDLFGTASSVVHGYAGRIMDDNQLTLPSFGVSQPSGTNYFDLIDGVYVWDGFEGIFTTGGVYDPNLKPSYSNQYSLGFTQKVWRNTSLDVTGQYRKQNDLFEDYCDSNDFPGQCVITNQPGADKGVSNALRSDYRGIIAKVESRPYKWLAMTASWTYAKSKGSTESTQNQNANFDYFPAHFTNYYGYLSDDARNRVKVDGYVHMPLDFTLGVNFYWDDGTPWSVFQTSSNTAVTGVSLPYGTRFIEPRGSRRLPSFSQTDIQLQKDFRIRNMSFGLIGSVFNIFNTETVTGINGNAGSRATVDPATGELFIGTGALPDGRPYQQAGANRISSTFGQPNSWQRPRLFEVGVRFEF